ncbi:2-iminoacetate synthase ThiH [Candidatus Providencia siddallii]|uniref:2-iminoacetate synthase n=1 Tax=Candidatus Providencia siddallii TaxID=1715285 RepID=A0ABM9NNL0_9GAMM
MNKNFREYFENFDWDKITLKINNKTVKDVEYALLNDELTLDDFMALLSPSACFFIEEIANKAQQLTRKRFGNTINFYLPLYLSNLCNNDCTYCGFSAKNNIKRKILNDIEVINECNFIRDIGFDSILLVTGEHKNKVGMNYFRHTIPIVREFFSTLMIEVQPLSINEYMELRVIGVDGVIIYQETYNSLIYKNNHIKGNKKDFFWRMNTPERIGNAGIDKIGLGILLGLSNNWRTDCYILAEHLFFLQKYYWKTRYSISFPRLRPCIGGINPLILISELELVQLICAFRLLFPSVELSLSTRESPFFRDNVIPIAINNISAGSKTQPGGYSKLSAELEQFLPNDNRTALQMINVLIKKGLQPVWKDWDKYFGR